MSDSEADSTDSEKELQIAYSTGLLKPGLNLQIDAPKTSVNNVAGLEQALKDLKKTDLPWSERLDMVNDLAPAPQGVGLNEDDEETVGDMVHDDFKREMRFYRQAQAAVMEALPRLKALNIPTKRPDDYFAEMAKSDDQMKKVREKLLSKQQSMERSGKAKKLRELRKYGKKVQQEVLLKRQKEKRQMMDQVKKFRKGQQDKLDFLDDKSGPRQKGVGGKDKKGKDMPPNQKRQHKNNKFGFGGQKKRSKMNTSSSAGDMSGYSSSTHGNKKKKNKNAAQNRPGKSRRQKMKNKKR